MGRLVYAIPDGCDGYEQDTRVTTIFTLQVEELMKVLKLKNGDTRAVKFMKNLTDTIGKLAPDLGLSLLEKYEYVTVKFEEGKKIGPDTPVYVLVDHILKLRAIQKGKGDSSFDEAYRAFIRIVDGKGIIERYQAM